MNALKYRREIDGLRALAVILVMLYHAKIPGFEGGFIGVDVFFVISGFLITSIIYRELDQQKFTLTQFYERRARRILPALVFVIVTCIPAAWFFMQPHQLKDFFQSIAAITMFASNILFWLETDYFAPIADQKPLIHTWSLAVEEQFYIFFPLIMMIVYRFARSRLLVVLFLLGLASLIFAEWAARNAPTANFFLIPSRAWELIGGAIVAINVANAGTLPKKSEALSVLGIGLILLSAILLSSSVYFPGLTAIPTILGTILVILYTQKGTISYAFFASKLLVGIGLISYSLYLWHQPLLAYARIALLAEPSLGVRLILLLAAFPLAYMSWRLIEAPFRSRQLISRRAIFSLSGISGAILLGVGYLGHYTEGFFEAKLSSLSADAREYVIDREAESLNRRSMWRGYLADSTRPFESNDELPRILLIGDSKSEDLYASTQLNMELFETAQIRRVRLDDLCMGGFVDVLGGANRSGLWNLTCESEIDNILSAGLIAEADRIVMTATWQLRSIGGAAETARYFANQGKDVVIMGTANFNDVSSLSMILAREEMVPNQSGRFFYDNRRLDWARISENLREAVINEENISYFDSYQIYCNESTQSCKLFDEANTPMIWDSGHVTVAGGYFLGEQISNLDAFRIGVEDK